MFILLIIAAILFSAQFIFFQNFQKRKGIGFETTLIFQGYVATISFFILLILNRFQVRITPFSAVMALFYAVVIISFTYFGMRAFQSANLSVYSIFSMLGGMVLPLVFGIVFYDEKMTISKGVCCALIVISLLLTLEKGKSIKKCWIYYIAIFILNGLMGVISKIHQSSRSIHTDSKSFMMIVYLWVFIICLLWYLTKNIKITVLKRKEFALTFGYAMCNCIAELFCLIALTELPASVQYPMISGGVILFSVIVSAIMGTKIKVLNVWSAVIALMATIIIMF